MGKTRNEKGQFVKGNEIGSETRFSEGHKFSDKYKEEYATELLDFFSQPATRVEYKETYFKGELTSRVPIVVANEYPTFQLFAAKIGVTMETLRHWCERYPQFNDTYIRAKEIQLGKLTSNTLTGLYNPVYAKFEAVNNHHMTDKQVTESKVEGNVSTGLDDKTKALIERVARRLNGDK